MALQTAYFKEHERIVHNSIGHLSSVPSAPWWSTLGSQSAYGESGAMWKSFSFEHPTTNGGQLSATKQACRIAENGNNTPFTIFPGDCKSSGEAQKASVAFSLNSSLAEYHACLELGFGQPMVSAKYPYMDQCYGIFSAYGHQVSGRIMLPLNLTTDDGPIYVNAKQYHGIIRRRQSRAKAGIDNRLTRVRKPYMHESRHLHAMRRVRGCGGRFLNTKNLNCSKTGSEAKKADDAKLSQSSGSQSSAVLQSDSGTFNSSKDMNGSGLNLSGSEVTSMYSRGDLDRFQLNHLGPSLHSLSDYVDNARGLIFPTKWVAAGDNCCNLHV